MIVIDNFLPDKNVKYVGFVTKINTMGAITGEGTAYPSGTPEFTPRLVVGFVLLNL